MLWRPQSSASADKCSTRQSKIKTNQWQCLSLWQQAELLSRWETCSVGWLLLRVVTEAPVRQTITHCNGVTSWTALLVGALSKHSCITCPRDLNAHGKQASQEQAVILTRFYSTQSISISAIGCSAVFTIWSQQRRLGKHLRKHISSIFGFFSTFRI